MKSPICCKMYDFLVIHLSQTTWMYNGNAGASLISPEGYHWGTLCIVDNKPQLLLLSQDMSYLLNRMSEMVCLLVKHWQEKEQKKQEVILKLKTNSLSSLKECQLILYFLMQCLDKFLSNSIAPHSWQCAALPPYRQQKRPINFVQTLVTPTLERRDFSLLIQSALPDICFWPCTWPTTTAIDLCLMTSTLPSWQVYPGIWTCPDNCKCKP